MKALPTDLPLYSFSSAKEFEGFLEHEHATASGFHLKLAKKSSGIPSVSASEAVEVALCYGWIDGRANGLDDSWWLVRYTPRRPKSIWSKKNVTTIGRLVEGGRMRPAGIAAVEAAKADGRWERAYAGPATMEVPEDLALALAQEPAAAVFFEALNKTERYAVLWRVETASPQSRTKRIQALVEMLAEGTKPGAPAKPKADAVTKEANSSKAATKQSPAHGKRKRGLSAPDTIGPVILIIYAIKVLPYLYYRPFIFRHIPSRRPGQSVRALVYNHPGKISEPSETKQRRPLHVDVHGGGFIGGIPEADTPFCYRLARSTGAVVVSITYRLAPRHDFPAAHDDVDDAVAWLLEHAEEEFGADPTLLTVSGFSAGGNLALAGSLGAKKANGDSRVLGVVTFYAPVSGTTESSEAQAVHQEV
ncbi:MAG: hypothetical protein LQ346_008615 [Caloplaca aetnensis]|nr:MAG: hypothetical protein LQ346_008615 [Caloplaca aetnensis]